MQDEVKVTQADRGVFGEVLACLSTANELRAAKDCNQAQQAIFWEQKALSVLARHRHQAERETLARMEWKGIESAPKDGSGVLMIDMTAPTPEASTAYFYEDKWWLLAEGDRSREDGAWAYNCPWYANPTHWMPLPPAPEAGQ